ncbi:MAG: S-layer homology domain-containing protein, partial [Oscillospiraceae bacterium]|nr:S-layer homology domain-containing protein [Oscillospiraceae bacterium]
MNIKRRIAMTLIVAAAALQASAAAAADELYTAKFDFGADGAPEGYIQISASDNFDEKKGYGLSETSARNSEKSDGMTLEDYITSETDKGIKFEVNVPDGDYEVKTINGGDTESEVNIYINGGERVRVFQTAANEYKENVQRVVPKNGKITFEFLGKDVKVNSIEIKQLENRDKKSEIPVIYIAGDSTAQTYDQASRYPQYGWGQVISDYLDGNVKTENRSMAGRSSKSYDNDGRLDNILTEIHPGDYVFIQFGHNDGSEKPERYISIDDFKKLITDKYIGETVKRGGIPVLLTPTPHFSPDDNGRFSETIVDYSQAIREVAESTGVPLIDIHKDAVAKWNELGKEEVSRYYFICEPGESVQYPEGTDDHTHFKEPGARAIAKLVAEGMKNANIMAESVISGPQVFKDTRNHWAEDIINKMRDLEFVKGTGENEFSPDGTVTRAEFLSMSMKAADVPGRGYDKEKNYSDVSDGNVFRFQIQGAREKNIIAEEMIENNKFSPDKAITRGEMASMLVRIYNLKHSIGGYVEKSEADDFEY